MKSRLCAGVLLLALLTTPLPAAGSGVYRPAKKIDGRVFPVARSTWFSVINFANDWYAPRYRRTEGRWALVGRHEGTDIFAEPGTPVMAMTGGTVTNLGWLFYSGWRVGIRGDDGRYWFYAHLRRYAQGLSVGDRVEAGSVLGEVGNTGYGTEPGHSGEFTYHLHLGIQAADGTWVNPYPLLRSVYRRTTR